MPEQILQLAFTVLSLAMIYASPVVAFWDLGAAVMFLIVGVGSLAAIVMGSQ